MKKILSFLEEPKGPEWSQELRDVQIYDVYRGSGIQQNRLVLLEHSCHWPVDSYLSFEIKHGHFGPWVTLHTVPVVIQVTIPTNHNMPPSC